MIQNKFNAFSRIFFKKLNYLLSKICIGLLPKKPEKNNITMHLKYVPNNNSTMTRKFFTEYFQLIINSNDPKLIAALKVIVDKDYPQFSSLLETLLLIK